MTKTTGATAFLLGFLLLAGRASAQDAGEVAKLKREIELLKKENDLLTRENALLKKEAEQLKTGGAKKAEDGLPPGSGWKGILYFTGAGGKKVQEEVTLKVTGREGKSFTAEFWVKNHTDGKLRGIEIKGTVEAGGVVSCKGSKVLEGATWAPGILDVTWSGQLKDKNKRVSLNRNNKDGSSHKADLTINE